MVKTIITIKELIIGLGIGLCFSSFYPIGVVLIVLGTVAFLLQKEESGK